MSYLHFYFTFFLFLASYSNSYSVALSILFASASEFPKACRAPSKLNPNDLAHKNFQSYVSDWKDRYGRGVNKNVLLLLLRTPAYSWFYWRNDDRYASIVARLERNRNQDLVIVGDPGVTRPFAFSVETLKSVEKFDILNSAASFIPVCYARA